MTNISELKTMLLEEKSRLEKELMGVGHKSPDLAGDWDPSVPDLNNTTTDPNEVADSIEAFEGSAAIEVELEARMMEIDAALVRIEAGVYGICRICGKAIEDARLHANPAASTCIEHREE